VPRRLSFREINPVHADDGFRAYVERALQVLAANPTLEARRTLKAIVTGRVRIDLLADLTAADFRRVRKDLLKWNIPLRESDYGRLHDTRSRGFRAIARVLNGYMWDDRVYIHRELSAKQLAVTLVHEVSHVLNRSEEHYRAPRDVLIEEYRAFYAEKRFSGLKMTPGRCHALKLRIIREYQLEGVAPEDIPDVPRDRKRGAAPPKVHRAKKPRA
jgi:hypothetical protein